MNLFQAGQRQKIAIAEDTRRKVGLCLRCHKAQIFFCSSYRRNSHVSSNFSSSYALHNEFLWYNNAVCGVQPWLPSVLRHAHNCTPLSDTDLLFRSAVDSCSFSFETFLGLISFLHGLMRMKYVIVCSATQFLPCAVNRHISVKLLPPQQSSCLPCFDGTFVSFVRPVTFKPVLTCYVRLIMTGGDYTLPYNDIWRR